MCVKLPAETSILIFLTDRVWETAYNGCANLTIVIIWFSKHQLLEILARVSYFLKPENRKLLFLLVFFSCLHNFQKAVRFNSSPDTIDNKIAKNQRILIIYMSSLKLSFN